MLSYMWSLVSSVLCFDSYGQSVLSMVSLPHLLCQMLCWYAVKDRSIDQCHEEVKLQWFFFFAQPYVCCINHIEESNLTISKDGIDGMNGTSHCNTCTDEWHFSCECSLDVEIKFSHVCPRLLFSSCFKGSSDAHGKRSILSLHPRSSCIFRDGTVRHSQWYSVILLEKKFRCSSFFVLQFFQLKIFPSSRWLGDTGGWWCRRRRQQGWFLVPSEGWHNQSWDDVRKGKWSTSKLLSQLQSQLQFHSFHFPLVWFGTYRQSNIRSHTRKKEGGGESALQKQEHK